ncbi:YncE family protein, partial [Mycobacterium avium]
MVLRGGALIGVLAVSVGALVMSVACSRPGAATESAPELTAWPVGTALHQPVWSYRGHALVAVTENQRVAEVAEDRAAAATTRLSAPLAAGRNLQISTKDPAVVFVPQPTRGRVAVVDLQSLRQVGDFDAGPAPAYLSEDAGLRMLLALSSDGRSVTPVDQNGYRKLATAPIGGTPAEVIDGANRGREIDYHVYAPSGIRHYQGPDSPAPQRGSLDIDVAVSAGDGTAVTRSYVAGHDDAVLYAVDSRRGGQGIEVLAST